MPIRELRGKMPEYAKDTKLNLGKIMDEEGVEGLSLKQGYMVALASSYATQHKKVIDAVHSEVASLLDGSEINAARSAATIMGMNNVYYRFVHLVSDKDYAGMPANLRMNVIGKPGVDKVDFELMGLAVSAINGCGMCIDAHVSEVIKGGVSKQGVQSAVRIAAVLMAAAQAIVIEDSNSAYELSIAAA